MIIKVNQEDIDKGIPSDCKGCALAVALKRNLGAKDVEVRVDDFHDILGDAPQFTIDGKIYNHDTFDSVSYIHNFIQSFDSQQEVKPFEFELKI